MSNRSKTTAAPPSGFTNRRTSPGTRAACSAMLAVLAFQFAACAEAVERESGPPGAQVRRDKSGSIVELWARGDVQVSAEDYARIGKMKALKTLFLDQKTKPLDDAMLAVLGPLETVEYLHTNMALLGDEGLKKLSEWRGLKRLSLIHWGWGNGWKPFPSVGKMPGKELTHLADLPNLTRLDLGGARIDDSALEVVAGIKTLEEVRLFHAVGITDAGVSALSALPKLRAVQFGSTQITDRALEQLSAMAGLEEIEVDETWLTYEGGFRHLKHLPRLRKLKLKDVAASTEDLARLKSDHPAANVEWTLPDETKLAKMNSEKARAQQGAAGGKK